MARRHERRGKRRRFIVASDEELTASVELERQVLTCNVLSRIHSMTVIEIGPHRWGWKGFEAPGVEPVFPKKDQARIMRRTAPASARLRVSIVYRPVLCLRN